MLNKDKKAGIYLNTDKANSAEILKKLQSALNKHGKESIVVENSKKNRGDEEGFEAIKSSCDIVFSVGGDGTLLSAQRNLLGTDIKILGINAGRRGFLVELNEEDMLSGIDNYFGGHYYVEERGTLVGSVCPKDSEEGCENEVAINEFAVARSTTTGIIKIKVKVNGEPTEAFSADGVLISTPTGSTAYSLAAGGPVIMPEVHCTLITPICAHSLHTRPFIAPDDLVIEVETEYREGDALLIADGQKIMKIPDGYKAVVKKADVNAKFVRIDKKNMYAEFRNKMLEHTD